MKTLKQLIFLIFISLIPVNTFCKEPVVIDNIGIATKQAKETNTEILLVFTADWCRYCVYLKNDLMKSMEQINSKYTVCFVDYDSNRDLARRYNVSSLPSSVILKEKTYKKMTGYSNFTSYKDFLSL